MQANGNADVGALVKFIGLGLRFPDQSCVFGGFGDVEGFGDGLECRDGSLKAQGLVEAGFEEGAAVDKASEIDGQFWGLFDGKVGFHRCELDEGANFLHELRAEARPLVDVPQEPEDDLVGVDVHGP